MAATGAGATQRFARARGVTAPDGVIAGDHVARLLGARPAIRTVRSEGQPEANVEPRCRPAAAEVPWVIRSRPRACALGATARSLHDTRGRRAPHTYHLGMASRRSVAQLAGEPSACQCRSARPAAPRTGRQCPEAHSLVPPADGAGRAGAPAKRWGNDVYTPFAVPRTTFRRPAHRPGGLHWPYRLDSGVARSADPGRTRGGRCTLSRAPDFVAARAEVRSVRTRRLSWSFWIRWR
jgi:hypothetical protein